MTVDEAAEFFKAVPAVRDKMETLQRRWLLGYIDAAQSKFSLVDLAGVANFLTDISGIVTNAIEAE